MSLSLSQQRTLAILPKISAGLSLTCSSLIAISVLRNKTNRQKVYHRLLLGMSFSDICSSFWYAMSTWPIPRDTPGIPWAVGNVGTCTAQGFFLQAGAANPLYNASLSFYFLMAVQLGRGESELRRFEPFFHILPLLWGYGTAIAGLPLKIFNSANLWCWIADYPGRSDNANIYRWVLFYAPLWLGVLTVTCNLIRLIRYVKRVEQEASKNTGPSCHLRTEAFEVPQQQSKQQQNQQQQQQSQISEEDDDDDLDSLYDDANEEDVEENDLPTSTQQRQEEEEEEDDTGRTKQEGTSSTTFLDLSERNSFSKTSNALSERRHKLVWQCLRYAIAFYATWTPITILRIFQATGTPLPFALLVVSSSATPLQGLPNFLAYLNPRLVKFFSNDQSHHHKRRRLSKNKGGLPAASQLGTERRSQTQPRPSPSDAFHDAYARARDSLRNIPSSGHNYFAAARGGRSDPTIGNATTTPRFMVQTDGRVVDRTDRRPASDDEISPSPT